MLDRRSGVGVIAVVALVAAACSGSPVGPSAVPLPTPSFTPDPVAPVGRVAIISIDGLRPDAVLQTGAPNIMALANRGAYTWKARTVLPSSTLPAHVSMLSGFPPDVHGITWDDYLPARGRITVPTLFSAARAEGLRTAMIAGKEKFTHFRDEGGCEAWVTGKGDSEIAAAAAGQVSWGVDLLFVHLPDVDAAGHALQWMSAGYLAAVRRADEAVGRIVAALPPDMTIILTADHGGHDTAHGSNDPTDVTIPWIIAGPGIATGRPIAGTVRTMDTAATAARVLGIRLSPGTTGSPVAEAFLPRPAAIAGPFPALFAQPGAGPQVTTR